MDNLIDKIPFPDWMFDHLQILPFLSNLAFFTPPQYGGNAQTTQWDSHNYPNPTSAGNFTRCNMRSMVFVLITILIKFLKRLMINGLFSKNTFLYVSIRVCSAIQTKCWASRSDIGWIICLECWKQALDRLTKDRRSQDIIIKSNQGKWSRLLWAQGHLGRRWHCATSEGRQSAGIERKDIGRKSDIEKRLHWTKFFVGWKTFEILNV